MKLIRIFALTMFTAVIAAAQGTPAQSGAANKPGSSQPASAAPAASPAKSPAVTANSKAAAKPGSATAKKTAAKPAAKPAATTTAKPANGKSPAAQPAAPKTSAPVTAKKPVVATGSLPEKTKSAAKSTAPAGKPKAVVANGAKPVVSVKPATAPKKAVVAKPAVKTAAPKPSIARVEPPPKQEKKPVPAKLLGAAGRRDPFISPIRNVSSLQPGQSCNSGKRCLAIPELILQGTVRDITGKMMAVVSTSNRRTYTLRENDQVFNGSVEKITTDSIIFREYVKDPLGREAAREVVKKLGPTS